MEYNKQIFYSPNDNSFLRINSNDIRMNEMYYQIKVLGNQVFQIDQENQFLYFIKCSEGVYQVVAHQKKDDGAHRIKKRESKTEDRDCFEILEDYQIDQWYTKTGEYIKDNTIEMIESENKFVFNNEEFVRNKFGEDSPSFFVNHIDWTFHWAYIWLNDTIHDVIPFQPENSYKIYNWRPIQEIHYLFPSSFKSECVMLLLIILSFKSKLLVPKYIKYKIVEYLIQKYA